ncbi:MAG TPA: hypothetical protein PKJ39_01590 [Caldisericia bacterium]|nr:hypothetical protein [Caldisericia bacterium]HQL65965.1 hypothetical protein [Caldisericia bacterium]
MYIPLVVIDTNLINSKQEILKMNEIEELFHLGLIDIYVSSVVYMELKKDKTINSIKRFQKISSYETLLGSQYFGDSYAIEWAGRKSLFDEIFKIIVGKTLREAKFQKDFTNNTFRDIIHLDECWINMADYFLTMDNKILSKRNNLYVIGYDIKIMTPDECLNDINNRLINDFNNLTKFEISERLKHKPPLILGTNFFNKVTIIDPITKEMIFKCDWKRNKIFIEAKIYNKQGEMLLEIMPDKEIEIKNKDVIFTLLENEFKVYEISLNSGNAEFYINSFLRIGDLACKRFSCSYNNLPIFYGRITPTNHILIFGEFYNSKGNLVIKIEKEKLIIGNANIS